MTAFAEGNYEQAVIELFENMGYMHIYGPGAEFRDYRCPFIYDVLKDRLEQLNNGLPEEGIQDALRKLTTFENAELVQKNERFMDYLQNGIPVRFYVNGEARDTLAYLIDYHHTENNIFIVANQWTFVENSEKRPDVILFINGLPLVIIELKSPSREETNASDAYLQLRNYMQEIPTLFIYNAICVMSDMAESKAGTITSGEERFMAQDLRITKQERTQLPNVNLNSYRKLLD